MSDSQKKVIVVDNINYFRDGYGFVYERGTLNLKAFIVEVCISDRIEQVVFEKRVNLIYRSKKRGDITICTSLVTLEGLVEAYRDANKETQWTIYKDALKIVSEIELIDEPTVEEGYRLIMAARSVVVIQHLITKTSMPVSYVTCMTCKTPDLNSSFKKCGGCKKVYYCSSDCTRVAWEEHKKVCRAMMCCEKWL
jgi:hypothetical protein